MVAHICKEIVTAMERERSNIDAKKMIRLIISHMLYDMCFGKKCSFGDPNVESMMDQMLLVAKRSVSLYAENYIPFLKDVLPTPKWRKMCKDSAAYINDLKEEIQKHKDSFNPERIRDYTDSIFLSNEGVKGDKQDKGVHMLTDTEILHIVSDVFLAGFETTKKTLEWLVYFLTIYPEYQKKCREEVDTVIGNCRPPKASDRENLHFLEACLMESIRRGAVGSRGIQHMTLCDTSVGGYDIPEGTIVMINLWALHNDPTYWKNVSKFDPDHFLKEDGKINHKPDNWLPFSAGRRVCLGEPVARCELVLIAAHILQNFVFTASPDDKHFPEIGHVNAGSEPPHYPNSLLEKRVVNY